MGGGELPKKSDLGVRTLSALAMVVVAGSALWLGGWWWTVFVAAVTLGVFLEWQALTDKIAGDSWTGWLWLAGAIVYLGVAAYVLVFLRGALFGFKPVLLVLLAVIATDIGAYFAGRTIGGPKIAPSISPSKTWAGLGGGILGAAAVIFAMLSLDEALVPLVLPAGQQIALASLVLGALIAIVAQTGDFFESWMKRRAGVKDSGALIPGHGGLFDRVDGLLAVLFVIGLLGAASAAWLGQGLAF